MGKPIISVILPTYNRVDYLALAIWSVKRQTFEDWELIVVDDCSTDNTKEVVSSFQFSDPRVRYLKTSEQSGSPVLPRNLGVSQAKGEYLAFIDSDDEWMPEKLEQQLAFMESIKAEFAYHDMSVQKVSINGDKVQVLNWSQMSACHSGKVFLQLLRKNFIPLSSVMVTKRLWKHYGPMDLRFRVSHDWDLWLKMAFENEIYFLSQCYGILRLHSDTVITDIHRRRKESREVVRKWMSYVDGMWYRKIMLYYYLMEMFDLLPESWQDGIRRWWFGRRP